MGRIETYTLAVATTLLSLYGKPIVRVLHLGWTQGRLNALQNGLAQIKAMRQDVHQMVGYLGMMILRSLLFIGLMIFFVTMILVSDLSKGTGAFFVALLLGILFGDMSKAIGNIFRVSGYEAYSTKTNRKIEKLTARLQQIQTKPAL